MQNKTYTELLDGVEALAGVNAFTTQEQTRLLANANRRLYQAYSATPTWQRYAKIEARPANDGLIAREYTGAARTVTTATRSGTTVTIVCDDAVDFVAGMYVTVASLSGTEDPNGSQVVMSVTTTTVDDDTFTFELDDGTGTETYSGSGTVTPDTVSDIGDFHRVYSGNPNNGNAGYDVEWWEDADGAHVTGNRSGLEGYWVSYKKEWGGPYTTASTDIPLEFYHYVLHATYADFLRGEGQNDKALAEEQAAQEYLAIELMKPANVRNANRLYSRVRTHNTTQAR